MEDLQDEFGLTYLFIAHDIGIVYHVSDRIAVMYLGNVVEYGTAEEVYRNPRHPYTRALLSAVPEPDPDGQRPDRIVLEGDIPTPLAKPSGCGFRTRCPIAKPECAAARPEFETISDSHYAACPHTESLRGGVPMLNPGCELDLDWVLSTRTNRSAIERRAATLGGRRTVKKEWQIAWLAHAVQVIDLTTLAGDDTPGTVRRLAAKAISPVRRDVLDAHGLPSDLHCGAVCVYHNLIPVAVEACQGTAVNVCAVSTGFPAGQIPHAQKLEQIRASVAAGAVEIDIVVSRPLVLEGRWEELYQEVRDFREACGESVHLKSILATGELATLAQVGSRESCLPRGGSRLHQDLDRQGSGERHPSRRARHAASDP